VLSEFIYERERHFPHGHALTPAGQRDRRVREWESETVQRYRGDLQPWVRAVFEESVDLGVVPPAARWAVDARSVTQIRSLPQIFHGAARSLERELGSARDRRQFFARPD
jgi:hypothetical protein